MIPVIDTGWLPIARGEYKLATSRFREIRSYFPYLLLAGAAIYVLYLAPLVVGFFTDEISEMLLSYVAAAIAEVILLMFFIMFMSLPIASTLQDINTSQVEILLAAPVKPGNILLGEFVGKIPVYSIFGIIIGGLFTAALFPLGLDISQVILVVVIFVTVFLLASWLGTLVAVILRSRLVKSSRGRDIGKGLAFIIMLPVVALFYAMIGGYMEFINDPTNARIVQDILGFFPSSWGADIIVDFAVTPGNVFDISTDSLIKLSGLVGVFIVSLWSGGVLANKVYNLEPSSFTASAAGADGVFYNTIRLLGGGGSSGALLSTSFKNYFRRFKNLTQLTYAVGLVIVMNIFLMQPDDPEAAFMGTFVVSGLLGMFVTSELTIYGKERLSLYKQAPITTWSFVRVKVYHYFLIIMPIAVIIEGIMTLLIPDISLDYLLLNLGLAVLLAFSLTMISTGMFLLNPAFDDKAPEFMINAQIIIFATIIPFFVVLVFLGLPFYQAAYLYGAGTLVTGFLLLALGVRKLDNME